MDSPIKVDRDFELHMDTMPIGLIQLLRLRSFYLKTLISCDI